MSEETRAGFYPGKARGSEDLGKESKRNIEIKTEQASRYLFLVCACARLQGMKSDCSPSLDIEIACRFTFLNSSCAHYNLCSCQFCMHQFSYTRDRDMLLSGLLQKGKAGSHIYTALSLQKSFIFRETS